MAYVRYLNDQEVVSASTDSTLRLWNVNQQAAARVFEGHVNEKNFVGLSADGEFIACGSELNEVCTLAYSCICSVSLTAYAICHIGCHRVQTSASCIVNCQLRV